jgi:hypothetical protein
MIWQVTMFVYAKEFMKNINKMFQKSFILTNDKFDINISYYIIKWLVNYVKKIK